MPMASATARGQSSGPGGRIPTSAAVEAWARTLTVVMTTTATAATA